VPGSVPERPYKSRDKAKVEVGFQVLGRWVELLEKAPAGWCPAAHLPAVQLVEKGADRCIESQSARRSALGSTNSQHKYRSYHGVVPDLQREH
jgi:hypothetical protein